MKKLGTYNLLSSHGFHVGLYCLLQYKQILNEKNIAILIIFLFILVTFDYRGYGDSYGDPTETNVVEV